MVRRALFSLPVSLSGLCRLMQWITPMQLRREQLFQRFWWRKAKAAHLLRQEACIGGDSMHPMPVAAHVAWSVTVAAGEST